MKRTVKDLVGLKGKVVLLRVDFNVPMDETRKILDSTRIDNALPTINYLIEQKARVVILSHLGRPKGFEVQKSLWPVAMELMNKLPCNVDFCNAVIGDEVKYRIKYLKEGNVLLLENTRFYEGEDKCDMDFAREIAALGDIYVNDAFGTAHRKNASTYALARLMPNAIGLLMEKEIENLSKVIENPKRPFVAILGGAKVDSKIQIIDKLLEIADTIIIGGAMAYTFLLARGEMVGMSLVQNDYIEYARQTLIKAEEAGKKILLPIDHVGVSTSDRKSTVYKVKTLKGDLAGYDIGEETIELYRNEINNASQIFWNGPVGMFEKPEFANGTKKIAEAFANSNAYSVVGGGDTVSAINSFGTAKGFDFISTGGGASMEFFENGTLPCIEVIQEKIR